MSTAYTAFRAARDDLLEHGSDYDTTVRTFRWPDVGQTFSWAIDWFDSIGRGNPARALWIVEEDGSEATYTFDEMVTRSDKLAAHLRELGVGKGDPVLLMLGNQVELWDSMLALMKIGAVISPTTVALGTADLMDRVTRARAKAIIVNPVDAGKLAELPGSILRMSIGPVPAEVAAGQVFHDILPAQERSDAPPCEVVTAAGDPVLYYFTSGTTKKPKLVEHTQVSYPVGHLSTMFWLGVRPGDVHLTISSPGWAKHAWSLFFAPWIAEATVFVYNYSRFDAMALMAQMRRAGVTTFCAPPTVWRMLIQADLSGGASVLREAIGAGEPLNPEVIDQVKKHWGVTIRDGFGQTETTCLIGNSPGQRVVIGSMGRPMPGVPIVLIDAATGEPITSASGEGEICLDLSHRPLNLMTGYLDDPDQSASVTAGGYYHTGDVASRDEDGYITYVGRTDDVFKSSDFKVSPFEVESVLLEHPAVAEAAVVPAPDPVRLAVPKAYVMLAAGWEPNEDTAFQILKYAREHLAPFLRVRRIEFGELPKTISGKIRRVQLRAEEDRRDAEGAVPATEYRDDQFPALKG